MDRDFYRDHMRKTMEWIQDQIDNHRIDPSHRGYHIEIAVEAQWLQQLIVECVANHEMLIECQRQLSIAAFGRDYRPSGFGTDQVLKSPAQGAKEGGEGDGDD